LRAQTPELADRYERYQKELGLSAEDAEHLTGALPLARYFDAAVAEHPKPASVARWLTNELLGLIKDRDPATLPLEGTGFGRFVALVDAGRLTQSAGKTLLADLLEHGGDPQARMGELGLEKVEDAGAIDSAIDRAMSQQAAEVQRYKSGEKKLFGVLMGAVMRELAGAADAAEVRRRLTERLS
jgi:Asp-tRNA(Asn)/Glu-tRNA(Gln) amidotransferase B subunit